MANKKFCTLNNNYELSFTNETQVIPCVEEDTAIPKLQFNFASLSTIQDAEAGSILGEYVMITYKYFYLLFKLMNYWKQSSQVVLKKLYLATTPYTGKTR